MRNLVLELRRQDINEQVDRALELKNELDSAEQEKFRSGLVSKLQRLQSGWPRSDEAEDLCDLINKQLSFYVGGVPGLGTFDESGYAIFRLYARGRSPAEEEEWQALDRVLWLSRKGLLHRVRKCDHESCGRWFYAKFDHQFSCREKCRIAKYRSSPHFKERKNQKQRENYYLHKYKNVVTRGGK